MSFCAECGLPTELSLAAGEFVSVVGPSGCGKSTLLKLIAGITPRSTDDTYYYGKAITRAQKGVGVVFQSPVLLPWLTVLDNVLLPLEVLRMNRTAAIGRALELLTLVGLQDFARKYLNELSGGMHVLARHFSPPCGSQNIGCKVTSGR